MSRDHMMPEDVQTFDEGRADYEQQQADLANDVEAADAADVITAERFKLGTGRDPKDDDLERCNCKLVGMVGHRGCGWCDKHDMPRFMCGDRASAA